MSFPNPAMLPFFAAGGAISGSSFGLFYTILMQVGYNYYGKIVLKDIQDGMSLFDALQKVQKDIRPFSDAMMQAALDAMPETIEKSIDAFTNVITSFGEERFKEISKSWLLPNTDVDVRDVASQIPVVPTGPERPEIKTFLPPTNLPTDVDTKVTHRHTPEHHIGIGAGVLDKNKKQFVSLKLVKTLSGFPWTDFKGQMSWNELHQILLQQQKFLVGLRAGTDQRGRLETSILFIKNAMSRFK